MPGLDGWRFCRLLRSSAYVRLNRVPVMVVSATFAGDQASRIAADLGADAFFDSPVDGKQFVGMALSLLRGDSPTRQLRVLIVENNPAQLDLLKQSFADHGYQVDTAFTAREATAAFAAHPYDVAVLDHHLPDGSGGDLLDVFGARHPGCVLLMMTTDPGPELALDWMKRGAAAYLLKPFEPEYLVELCSRGRRERDLLRVQDLLKVQTCELRENEERNRRILEHMRMGVVVHGPDTAIQFGNQEAVRILGLSAEQMLGITALDPGWRFVCEDGSTKSHEDFPANRVAASLQAVRGQVLGVDRPLTGDRVWVQVNAYPEFDREGDLLNIVVTFIDITEHRQLEKEQVKLEGRLQQAQKMESVGRLAGGVAHDFNNMLGVILGHTELALDQTRPDQPQYLDLVEIKLAAERSANLTRQLLGFASKQTVAPKVLDLNQAVPGMLKMLRRLIGEDIDLVWRPGSGLWMIQVDPSQVDQILANLCVNARDAITGVGKITIETKNSAFDEAYCATHPGFVPGEYVRLAFSDDSCGMDSDTLDKLFEPFFTTKELGKGTGLGLATVYGIVKQNDGFINVYSEPDQGTIMLVEDEPAILKMTMRMLEMQGYRVLAAGTPNEALRLAREATETIHLLVSDVVMPEMNGRGLGRSLLDLYPDLKLLFMSGYTANVIALRGGGYGGISGQELCRR